MDYCCQHHSGLNDTSISFPASSGNWSSVTHAVLMDATMRDPYEDDEDVPVAFFLIAGVIIGLILGL